MLTAGGTYVEDIALPGRGVAHLRPVALRPRPHHRHRRVRGQGGARRARHLHRRRPRPSSASRRTPTPTYPDGDAPAVRRHRDRALRRPAGRGGDRRGPRRRRPTPPTSCSSTTTRCPPSSIPRRRCATRCCCSPTHGTNVVMRFASPSAGRLQRVRGRRRGADRQPADDGGADRSPIRRRLLDRRRPPRPLLGVPGRAPDEGAAGRDLRARPVAGAGGRARRRRRLRRQVAHVPRGARPRLLRPRGRPAGALDRDPHREHPRHAPRAGAGAAGQARRHARRADHRLPARRRAGRRRLPAHRRLPAGDDPAHDDRRLRPRQRRLHRRLGGDQHGVDDRVPRRRAGPRRPSRSSGWSTGSPPRSAWTRPRCGGATTCPASPSRTPPASAPSTTSATTPSRSTGRSTAPGTTSCAPSRRAGGPTGDPVALGIGDRHVRRDHRRRAEPRVRLGRGPRRRRAPRASAGRRRTGRATTRRGR